MVRDGRYGTQKPEDVPYLPSRKRVGPPSHAWTGTDEGPSARGIDSGGGGGSCRGRKGEREREEGEEGESCRREEDREGGKEGKSEKGSGLVGAG